MFVVVTHEIQNPNAFLERGQALAEAPKGVRSHQFFPTKEGQAFCLWEGGSLHTIRQHIDGTLGDASRQSYHVVVPEQATGLPKPALVVD